MFLFLNLNHFSRKNDENIYHFYNIFSKFLSPCTCSQNSVIFSKKRCCSFKTLTDNYLFSQFWESLVTKLMKRLTIFRTFSHFLFMGTLTKFCHLKVFTKKVPLIKNVNKLLFISATLSNICDKRPVKFFTYSEHSTSFLHVDNILLS